MINLKLIDTETPDTPPEKIEVNAQYTLHFRSEDHAFAFLHGIHSVKPDAALENRPVETAQDFPHDEENEGWFTERECFEFGTRWARSIACDFHAHFDIVIRGVVVCTCDHDGGAQ